MLLTLSVLRQFPSAVAHFPNLARWLDPVDNSLALLFFSCFPDYGLPIFMNLKWDKEDAVEKSHLIFSALDSLSVNPSSCC
jgi:hypothetical protein